jgi:hypothetical protein
MVYVPLIIHFNMYGEMAPLGGIEPPPPPNFYGKSLEDSCREQGA